MSEHETTRDRHRASPKAWVEGRRTIEGCVYERVRFPQLFLHFSCAPLVLVDYACPSCFHHFMSTTGLIEHMERTNNCRIRNSHLYRPLIEQLTGGFADAVDLRKDEKIKYVVQLDMAYAGGFVLRREEEKELQALIKSWFTSLCEGAAAAAAGPSLYESEFLRLRLEWRTTDMAKEWWEGKVNLLERRKA